MLAGVYMWIATLQQIQLWVSRKISTRCLTSFCSKVAKNDEMTRWENGLASGIKARATWHGVQTIQVRNDFSLGVVNDYQSRLAEKRAVALVTCKTIVLLAWDKKLKLIWPLKETTLVRREYNMQLMYWQGIVLTQEPAKILLMMYMRDTSIAATDDLKSPQNNVDLTSVSIGPRISCAI